MKSCIRCWRILILCLLSISVLVPLFLLSFRLTNTNSHVLDDFVEDLSIIKHRSEVETLRVVEQENGSLTEPAREVYKVESVDPVVNSSISGDTKFDESTEAFSSVNNVSETKDVSNERGQKRQQEDKLPVSESKPKEGSHVKTVQHDKDVHVMQRRALDEKIKGMKDQVVRAKAYLNFTPPKSSSHFVKELKLRIKDVERSISQSIRDSRVSRSTLQKMKAMDSTLLKASRIFPDCAAMVKKLRAMTYNAEEQVRSQRSQEIFLKGLGARTIPKGLHCLSMRLTADYFALEVKERELPNKHKLRYPDHYHIAIFSDNILACSVVVNSTISTASEPEKIVFHIVTDTINFPAMSMWFLSNPPNKATVSVESIDNFQWLSTKYNVTLRKEGSVDPRYTSELNHLRFYLPDIFPHLNKLVLLDHDVVVQRDLTRLWDINMNGKVNGAVQTCDPAEPSYRRMDVFVNFTDPIIGKRFDAKACTWAFGMNLFDLKQWRSRDITGVYHKYLRLGSKRPLWKSGSMPIGWITFYTHTFALDKAWNVLGLGYDSALRQENIDQAAVLHFDGILKPWLDIGIEKYKHFWRKHVKYEHPYLQQCNIHE